MSEKGNQAVKTVSFMMLITLFGKILGMVREQLLAANYGTDMQAAAFLHRQFLQALSLFLWNICRKRGGRRRFRLRTALLR